MVAPDDWQDNFYALATAEAAKFQEAVQGYAVVPDHRRAVHMLDMAVQECSEAWDLLEGGWKHHKKNPKPTDWAEVKMEIVDVFVFVINAQLYGTARNVGDGDFFFSAKDEELYGHGAGAHGDDRSKKIATYVNGLRTKLVMAADFARRYGGNTHSEFSAAHLVLNALIIELFDSRGEFINMYYTKAQINWDRIRGGY